MSRNVLIISASPRKGGNSDMLCESFCRGAKEAGHNTEKVRLSDIEINFCRACDACRNNGGKCAQKDGMADMLEKMIAADIIVMATPVYFYTMSGQLKTFIDRTYSRFQEIRGKDFYLILTAAAGNQAVQRTVEDFRGFMDCLNNVTEKAVIYGTGAWVKGDIQKHKAMEEAYNLGKAV